MLDITRCLTISTSHITRGTAVRLDNPKTDFCVSIFNKGEYGWWIYIPSYYRTAYHLKKVDVPKDLNDCINLAIKNHCEWLCLDCDGAETDQLETYEW